VLNLKNDAGKVTAIAGGTQSLKQQVMYYSSWYYSCINKVAIAKAIKIKHTFVQAQKAWHNTSKPQ